jgi:hypothetical protein
MCDYRRGFRSVNRFIDRLNVVTTNDYKIIAVSTIYNSLVHTDKCSQSVTTCFLVMDPTMANPLPPGSNPLFTDSRTELSSESESYVTTDVQPANLS